MLNLGRMATIPITTIAAQHELVENQLLDAFADRLFSQSFIAGEEVAAFEREFAQFCGTRYAIATNSGTTALVAALSALHLRSTDEVITTPLSFSATADAIVLAGGKPVFADIDPSTGNLDPKAVGEMISSKTKAVIVVHLYGVPANMKRLKAICKRARIVLIEDASHAHGSEYSRQKVGSLADIGCFSLYPAKIMGALGNAGIVTTSNPDLAALIRSYCHHGLESSAEAVIGEKYHHVRIGTNGGMDAVQAAALRIKLPLLPGWIKSRRQIADRFSQMLQQHDQQPMCIPDKGITSLYTYALRTTQREELRRYFHALQIETRIYYPVLIPLLPSYLAYKFRVTQFPVAQQWAQTVVSIPLYQNMPAPHQHRILTALDEFFS